MERISIYFCAVVFMTASVCVLGDSMECLAFLPRAALQAMKEKGTVFPNEDELAAICPGIKRMLDCFAEKKEEKPDDSSEQMRAILKGWREFFVDMCMEESHIRLKYLKQVDCLKNEVVFPVCNTAAQEGYEMYKLENGDASAEERACFQQGHRVGCYSVHALKTCGREALSIYHHFLNRSLFLFGVCDPASAQALKTKYLKSLHQDDEIRDVYEETFNLGYFKDLSSRA